MVIRLLPQAICSQSVAPDPTDTGLLGPFVAFGIECLCPFLLLA
jgi:hypothetical protein